MFQCFNSKKKKKNFKIISKPYLNIMKFCNLIINQYLNLKQQKINFTIKIYAYKKIIYIIIIIMMTYDYYQFNNLKK